VLGTWIVVTAMLNRVSLSSFEIGSQAMTAELTGNYANARGSFCYATGCCISANTALALSP
jgi:hypothetical protein